MRASRRIAAHQSQEKTVTHSDIEALVEGFIVGAAHGRYRFRSIAPVGYGCTASAPRRRTRK